MPTNAIEPAFGHVVDVLADVLWSAERSRCWLGRVGGEVVRDEQPVPSSPAVSVRMSRARQRDTAPEVAVRREAHRRGLRYLVDAPLPDLRRRRADMLFPRRRVAVFVDGCFWHSCPIHATVPTANGTWWMEKLAGNVARDRDTDAHLERLGWTVLRFWEHELPVDAVDVIELTVRDRSG